MKNIFCLVLLLSTLSSCNFFRKNSEEKNGKVIAKVFDKKLYSSDIEDIVPKGLSPKDSSAVLQTYIANWVRQNVILYHAENSAAYEKENMDLQLENYRNSLVIFAYEQDLIKTQLDTKISEEEMNQFYRENTGNFVLDKDIIKCSYIKISKSIPQLNKIVSLFKSMSDKSEIEKLCAQNAALYSFNDTVWTLSEQLLSLLPVDKLDMKNHKKKGSMLSFQDDAYLYLLKITDYKEIGSISPMEFETDNIKTSIINKRKLKLINEFEKKLYDDAVKNKDIEVIDSQ